VLRSGWRSPPVPFRLHQSPQSPDHHADDHHRP
jgi:hypothetical protein